MSQKILNDDSLTFAEKAISIRSEGAKTHHPGDITVIPADMAMAQDSTGPLAIKVFGEMGVPKVWDPSKIHLAIDHTFPAADEKVANLHHLMREFAKKYGVRLVEGSISHQHLLENHIVPGMVLFGADSHTCQGGAIGAFATGIGSSEMAAVWASGRLWVRVPESLRINVTGQFKKGVYARDVISNFIGSVGEDGGNYRSLEWKGSAVKDLSMASRACISNNSMECGCKLSIFEIDPMTQEYVRSVNRKPMFEIHAGPKAHYMDEHEIELNKLEPEVAEPGNVDKVKAVGEVEGTPIDEAFIGSSTNGRFEDLTVAAKILKGHKVKKGTRCIITPASAEVFEQAVSKGLAEIFLQSGAVFTNATCGACVGTHLGVLGDNEVCISSSPRNFVGRMGAITAKIYLSSPATAAASAIEGKIADPRRYL
ncbi:MAG TPA: aconitase/3-isopropylmalate dehydratase large subunit family protein [Candidatus Bathyarchaeia archaeon]|nr:aconitase/3-isopropylmalate dehydratase large subunit family protein [Candidatus Bathyarchaeia archaeon]